MHELVTLLDRYTPGFADQVIPAEERRIRALDRLAGPIPGAFLRFLHTMGGSPPQLLTESLRLGVDPLRRAHTACDWLKDERYFILSTLGETEELDVWMDRQAPAPPDDAMIVVAKAMVDEAPHPKSPYAVSLEDLLYVEGFRAHRVSLFSHQLGLTAPDDRLDPGSVQLALAAPTQLGFTRLAPQRTSGLFDRDDAAIIIRRAPFDASLQVHLGAEDPNALQTVAEAFKVNAGW